MTLNKILKLIDDSGYNTLDLYFFERFQELYGIDFNCCEKLLNLFKRIYETDPFESFEDIFNLIIQGVDLNVITEENVDKINNLEEIEVLIRG